MQAKAYFVTAALIILSFSSSSIFSQCLSVPAAVNCTGSEPLVVADETINSGTTKWYYGGTTTLNSLTLKGGKLIVCGDLTIDKFYMDSGQIIINWGARFVIGSGIGAGLQLKGNCAIYNYGTLEVMRNITLESLNSTPATPNIIANAGTSSSFRMPNQYFVITDPNSWFINKGRATFWGLITDPTASPNSVCLGPESVTSMATLINKVLNTYTVPDGNACVYVFQFSQFTAALTASSALFACLGASHTSCSSSGCIPNAWGAAQVFTSCNTCASLGVLGVRFVSLTISGTTQGNLLKWEMGGPATGYIFYIERSVDGKEFSTIGTIEGNNSTYYSYTDMHTSAGVHYYRIRCARAEGGLSVTSKTVSYILHPQKAINLYPSYFTGSFFISLPGGESPEQIALYDINGRNIPVNYSKQGDAWQINSPAFMARQVYFIRVVTKLGIYTERIVHQ